MAWAAAQSRPSALWGLCACIYHPEYSMALGLICLGLIFSNPACAAIRVPAWSHRGPHSLPNFDLCAGVKRGWCDYPLQWPQYCRWRVRPRTCFHTAVHSQLYEASLHFQFNEIHAACHSVCSALIQVALKNLVLKQNTTEKERFEFMLVSPDVCVARITNSYETAWLDRPVALEASEAEASAPCNRGAW